MKKDACSNNDLSGICTAQARSTMLAFSVAFFILRLRIIIIIPIVALLHADSTILHDCSIFFNIYLLTILIGWIETLIRGNTMNFSSSVLKSMPGLYLQVDWLKWRGLAGVMVWSLDLDDFNSRVCGQGRYPLLNAVVNRLRNGPTW